RCAVNPPLAWPCFIGTSPNDFERHAVAKSTFEHPPCRAVVVPCDGQGSLELPSVPSGRLPLRAVFVIRKFLRALPRVSGRCQFAAAALKGGRLGGGAAGAWDGHPLVGLDWPHPLISINPVKKLCMS